MRPILLLLLFCKTSFAQNTTTIAITLKKDSKLFLTYPISVSESNTITIYLVSKDTSFNILINSKLPFDVSNLNQTITPYLLFPNTKYNLTVNKNESILNFKSVDKQKETVANFFMNLENGYYKMDVTNDKKAIPILFNKKTYTKKIDSFLLSILSYRLIKIKELYNKGVISYDQRSYLQKFTIFDIEKNRLMPIINTYFDENNFPIWNESSLLNPKEYNDSTLLMLSSFKKSLIYSNSFRAKISFKNVSLESEFNIAKTTKLNTELKDYLLFSILSNRKNYISSSFRNYIDSLNEYCTNNIYKIKVMKNFVFVNKESTKKDELFNTKGEIFKIDSILQKQQKIIVIDFWASWCVPCKKEFQTVEKLISKFPKDSISFLFISLDDNINNWESSSKQYLFLNNQNSFVIKRGFNSDFAKKLQIQSIPRHCILSNDGRIIYDNVNSDELDKILTNLNKVIIRN